MATQAGPSALPHTLILESDRISQSAAHDFLTAYLERASSDPGFQPDSTLSPQGPVTAGVGSSPNLVIHNLKRIQAGLAGEVLGRDLIYAKLESEGGGAFELQSHDLTGGQGLSNNKAGEVSGWQDLESFERGQSDIVKAGNEDGGNLAEGVGYEVDVEEDGIISQGGKIDKEERKRRKKERKKEERRNRQQVEL